MKLIGKCNQCGLCCMEGNARCINLEILFPLGTPGATRCKIYEQTYPGMPIVLMDGNRVTGVARCARGSALDDVEIMAKGIGKGCSLKVVED